MSNPARRLARAVTSPVRNYLNEHFEQVKQEVRQQGARADTAPEPAVFDDAMAERLAEVEQLLAEQALHQAQALAGLAERVDTLAANIAELERVVYQLARVAAATVPD